jgi:hypothetical protein
VAPLFAPKYSPEFNAGLESNAMRGCSAYFIHSFFYALCTAGQPDILASLSYKKRYILLF